MIDVGINVKIPLKTHYVSNHNIPRLVRKSPTKIKKNIGFVYDKALHKRN